MTKAQTITDERTERIKELIAPFRWTNGVAKLTPAQIEDLDCFLDACESHVFSTEPIPSSFWARVAMPSRCEPEFQNKTNAKALAIALTPSAASLFEWIGEQSGASDESIQSSLCLLPPEMYTAAGTVFAETKDSETKIWFGRKANRNPQLSGPSAIAAVRTLFLIPAAGELKCRVCGCTEEDCRQCIEATGEPCSWIEIDLCSRCDTAARSKSVPKNAARAERKIVRPVHSKTPELKTVPVNLMVPSRNNHRKAFDQRELQELADSIKTHGVLQPLLVCLRPDAPESYGIIAGERRWRAAQLAGLTEVPVQIVEREGVQRSLAMLEENIRRVDLSPIERAEAIASLVRDHKLSQKEVGQMIGCSQGQVSNELRLLQLPEVLRQHVSAKKLPPTLIRSVLPCCDIPPVMQQITKTINEWINRGQSIEASDLDNWMRTAIVQNSRSMKYDSGWQSFIAPDAKKRHFARCSEEDLKALKVREFDFLSAWEGQQRTFELQKFDELNRKPLAARREKHKEYKASRSSHNASTASDPNSAMCSNQWLLKDKVLEDLTRAFCLALRSSKDKAVVNRICLAIAITDNSEMVFHAICGVDIYANGAMDTMLKTLDCSQRERDDLFRNAVIANCERGELDLDLELLKASFKVLGVELASLWQPSASFFEVLTDAGRAACAALVDLPAEANSAQLAKLWPVGLVPEFVRPSLGLPEIKPVKNKAKQGSAA